MSEEERLRRVTQKARSIAEARKPRPLGELVGRYMAERVDPRHDVFESVAAAWAETVPQGMAGFCRLADVTHGKARVVVSSPSHLYQLQLCGPQLLGQLQQRCGKKTVRYIKFEIGR
jgi:predicted nucleic acid-binding Zn ribbon protein